MAEKVMTLYFEDSAIKLLVTRGRKAEQWESVHLEPGLVVGGVIVNETKVAEKIKEVFSGVKGSGMGGFVSGRGKIIVGLNGRDSLYRVVSLPVLEKAMIPEAVRREAGRVIPVALDQLYLAYQRIPGSDTETRVFIAAYPKIATDTLIKTLRLAGITPRILDLAPLALCMSVNEPMAVIVDASLDTLNIMVMAERVPQVIRSLPLQGEGKSITDNMATISEEFSRTVAFYNSTHAQTPLSLNVPVFVSGDLAKRPDIWPALVGKLNSKVDVLPHVVQYSDDFPAGDFLVNLALAAKVLGLDKEHGNYSLVNLNALPASAKPAPINPYRIIVPIVAVIGIAGVYFLWNNLQTSKSNTASVQTQVNAKQVQLNTNTKDIGVITGQNRTIQLTQLPQVQAAAKIFPNEMATITAERTLTESQVREIISLKPAVVDFSAVHYNASDKSVTGAAGTQTDILAYATALRDTGGFKVVISQIAYNPATSPGGDITPVYDFTFSVQ
jgi:type IV pilus assembly protein PilM